MDNKRTFGNIGITMPEDLPDFNSQGNIGSWRQLLNANIGRLVRMEIAVVIDGPLRTAYGEIYFVGNSYVVLINNGKPMAVDILGIKFAYFE